MNIQIGVGFILQTQIGGSYKNLNLGVGLTTAGWDEEVPVTIFLSYNLPFRSIKKGLL